MHTIHRGWGDRRKRERKTEEGDGTRGLGGGLFSLGPMLPIWGTSGLPDIALVMPTGCICHIGMSIPWAVFLAQKISTEVPKSTNFR
jgi:hypothetical protein